MYIERVPNRNSPPAILLRESRREGKKTLKRTLANLSDWPEHKLAAFRLLLRGETLVRPEELFSIERSTPHGHVEAVLGTSKKLGLEQVISSQRCRERDLVVGMVAERLLHPCSKLATTRLWHNSTLAEELGISDADENDLYAAMDWLLGRQKQIEKKLAQRHLSDGAVVLYDISSSYYEGQTCQLVKYGYSRDGKKGLPIIVYGVITDGRGRPIAVDVYPGNTSDSKTVPDQVGKVMERFGLKQIVIVGDRGMLTGTQIESLKEHPGIGWISALRSSSIRALVDDKRITPSLFDERNLAEISSPEYPGERLIACHNPLQAEKRRRTREQLLLATEKELEKVAAEVGRRRTKPLGAAEIGIKTGKILGRYKMGKHFELTIKEGEFNWTRKQESIVEEEQLDGIYVIRASEKQERFSAEDTVRAYKGLTQVEEAFRAMKGINIQVRPIHHRTEDHVRAHIFLCMLTYYVEWEMRKALAPLLFDDEELDQNRQTRDPILPAQSSKSAKKKKQTKMTWDGLPVHSFETLLEALKTRCRNTCRVKSTPGAPTITQLTEPNPLQQRAFQLLGL